MKQYYKILHEDLIHYGMQYHLGLNEDIRPFVPETKYGTGIFFTDKEHVLDYLYCNQGTKLAIIEIPEGEQIMSFGNGYKAHRIVITEIQDLWITENYDWMKNYFKCKNILFQCACKNGALDFAKWLYNSNIINNPIDEEYAFCEACANGHLEIAQWLFSLGVIKIPTQRDYSFQIACINEQSEIIKWLYSLGKIKIVKDWI